MDTTDHPQLTYTFKLLNLSLFVFVMSTDHSCGHPLRIYPLPVARC